MTLILDMSSSSRPSVEGVDNVLEWINEQFQADQVRVTRPTAAAGTARKGLDPGQILEIAIAFSLTARSAGFFLEKVGRLFEHIGKASPDESFAFTRPDGTVVTRTGSRLGAEFEQVMREEKALARDTDLQSEHRTTVEYRLKNIG